MQRLYEEFKRKTYIPTSIILRTNVIDFDMKHPIAFSFWPILGHLSKANLLIGKFENS